MNTTDRANNLLVFVVVVVLSLFQLLFGVFIGADAPVIAGLSSLPAIVVFFVLFMVRESDVFSPRFLIALHILFAVSLQGVYFAYADNGVHRYGMTIYGLNDYQSLIRGLMYITLGVVMFYLGYGAVGRRVLTKRKQNTFKTDRLFKCCLVLLAISLAGTIAFFLKFDVLGGGIERLFVKRRIISEVDGVLTGGYLRFASGLSVCAFAISEVARVASKASGKAKYRQFAYISFLSGLVTLTFSAFTSSRFGFIQIVLAYLFIQYFFRGGLKIGVVFRYTLIAVLVLLTLTVLRVVQQTSTKLDDVRVLDVALSSTVGSNNLLALGKTSVILDKVPQTMPYKLGETYTYFIVAPIPRSIWPSKPNVKIGRELASTVFGVGKYTGVPPGAVGELYLNFGVAGVIFGMFVWGVLMRLFYNKYGSRGVSGTDTLIIYSLAMPVIAIVFFGGDFTGFVSRTLQVLVPVFICLRISSSKISHRYAGSVIPAG